LYIRFVKQRRGGTVAVPAGRLAMATTHDSPARADLPLSDADVARLVDGLRSKLSQGPHIDPQHAACWLQEVARIDGRERLAWHMGRLFGIGGSEIGPLVRFLRHEFHPFSSARDVVASKLMLRMPSEGTDDTHRGQLAEEVIRDLFLAQSGGERDETALRALARKRGRRSWQIGHPDDVVLIGGKRFIVDYKAPKPDVLSKYHSGGIEPDYVAQVHHYEAIARDHGIAVHGRMVVCLDLLAWRPVAFPVEHDEALLRDILEAGDLTWNEHVLKGELPPWSLAPRAAAELAVPDAVLEAAEDYLKLNLLTLVADERRKGQQERIKQWLKSQGRLDGRKVDLGVLKLSSKTVLDAEGLARDVEAYGKVIDPAFSLDERCRGTVGVDPEAGEALLRGLMARAVEAIAVGPEACVELAREVATLTLPVLRGPSDPALLKAVAVDLSVALDGYMTEEPILRMASGKSAHARLVTAVRDAASAVLDDTLQRIGDQVHQDDAEDLWAPAA
jgi:hypothetical protein